MRLDALTILAMGAKGPSARAAAVHAGGGASVEDAPPDIGWDDDDEDFAIGQDDDELDDLEDEISELEGDEDSDSDDIGADAWDEEYGSIGARRSSRRKLSSRQIKMLKRKLDRVNVALRRARSAGNQRRVQRLEVRKDRINSLLKRAGRTKRKTTKRRSAGPRRAPPSTRSQAVSPKREVQVGDARVILDPKGTYSDVSMRPSAAPIGPDWAGAVANPRLLATIPAGGQTTPQPLTTQQFTFLSYLIINLRIRLGSADALFGLLGNQFQADGDANFLPGTITDLLPWSVDSEANLPGLRFNSFVEINQLVTGSVNAYGTAAATGSVIVSLITQIITDTRPKTMKMAQYKVSDGYPPNY